MNLHTEIVIRQAISSEIEGINARYDEVRFKHSNGDREVM